jgi:ribosomal protein S18 acetylase RimI-like enzyme
MPLFEKYKPQGRRRQNKSLLSGLLIRAAKFSDAPILAELAISREPGDPDRITDRFKNEIVKLDPKHRLLLVAEIQEKIIAYARTSYFKPPEGSPSNICPEGWYLTGLLVAPTFRRQGVASALTAYRLDWITERADRAYYFSNARNRVSIELHGKFGFREISRNFIYPGVEFEGGEGILFTADLHY